MLDLPANLPAINSAKLPQTYEAAKTALAECSRVDECASWAKKAEALASYAKQAEDDTLRKMADRIQARAIRRCGELLHAITPAPGGRPEKLRGALPLVSRAQAARDAGLSRDQKRTALRVAGIAAEDFETAIESDEPPTVTDLAQRGTQRRSLPDLLRGRAPADFKAATRALGEFRTFVAFIDAADIEAINRGAAPKERRRLGEQATQIATWLRRFRRQFQEEERRC